MMKIAIKIMTISIFQQFINSSFYQFILDCGLPPTPSNGSVWLNTNVTTYGATASQTCDPGYKSNDTVTISCGENGTWSGAHMVCTLKGTN